MKPFQSKRACWSGKAPWQIPECAVCVAVGHDGAGEGKLVGWAGPDRARACKLQKGFQTLEYNKPMKFLTRVFLKFPSVLKDHSHY